MELHQGRLIDHVHLRVADLNASKIFYQAILETLGLGITQQSDAYFAADELFVTPSDEYVSKVHLAFQAANKDIVAKFHTAGLAHGGTDNGAPGERDYHPGYYGAFLLDPDGNNIEAVFHGPADRSAKSVIITPLMEA